MHGRAGIAVIGMHLRHQPGVIQHDLGGPKRRRTVARTMDQFLAHATIKQDDICHG